MALSENLRNDMPGDLRDRIVLWDAINRILKNNGIVDTAAIDAKIEQVKVQLNTLLSAVLGLEHTIDGVHNYDDTSMKTQIATIQNNLGLARTDINSLQTRTGNLESEVGEIQGDLAGIDGSANQLSLYNTGEISLSTLVNNHGTKIDIIPGQIALINNGENGSGQTVMQGQITIGNNTTEGGVNITTDTFILLQPRTGQGNYLRITPEATELAGLAISKNAQGGITFTNTTAGSNQSVTIPWD
jgi:hypothetical protein